LDHIADAGGGRFTAARRAQAVVLEGRLGIPGADARVVLAKTTTFMNVSGGPVKALAAYYDIPPERIIAVHDVVHLPSDPVRVKHGGGEGGHNGRRDISRALGTKDYLRVRVGVGRPTGGRDTADHVLAPFSTTERRSLEMLVSDAADAVESVILEGLTAAQQRFHSREARRTPHTSPPQRPEVHSAPPSHPDHDPPSAAPAARPAVRRPRPHRGPRTGRGGGPQR